MDEKSDQIVNHIETQRSQLGRNLDELESRVRSTTDWRRQFDQHPAVMMGVALGGGLLLGALVNGSSSRRNRGREYGEYGYSGESYSSSGSGSALSAPSSPGVSYQKQRAWETLENIKGAMIAFGTAKLKEFLSQSVPEFDRHYHETEQKSTGTNPSSSWGTQQTGSGSYQPHGSPYGSGPQPGSTGYQSGSYQQGSSPNAGGYTGGAQPASRPGDPNSGQFKREQEPAFSRPHGNPGL